MYLDFLIPSYKFSFRCFIVYYKNCEKPFFLLRPDLSIVAVVPIYFCKKYSARVILPRIPKLLSRLKEFEEHLISCDISNFSYLHYAGRRYKTVFQLSKSEGISIYKGFANISVRIHNNVRIMKVILNWYFARAKRQLESKLNEAFYLLALFKDFDKTFINLNLKSKRVVTAEYCGKDHTLLMNPMLVKFPFCFIEYFVCYCLTREIYTDISKKFFDVFFAILPLSCVRKYRI